MRHNAVRDSTVPAPDTNAASIAAAWTCAGSPWQRLDLVRTRRAPACVLSDAGIAGATLLHCILHGSSRTVPMPAAPERIINHGIKHWCFVQLHGRAFLTCA